MTLNERGVRLLFYLAEPIKFDKLAKLFANAAPSTYDQLILVTAHKLTTVANKKVTEKFAAVNPATSACRIEKFSLEDLSVDIAQNAMVPTHIPLSVEQRTALFARHKPATIPTIQRTDQMARYLGLQPGDAVKILRPSMTSGASVSYRYCH